MPMRPHVGRPRYGVRRRAKPDAGQPAIVAALRAVGCSVEVLSDVGRGVPDLLVGRADRNYLLEVKSPMADTPSGLSRKGASNRHQIDLNDLERAWHNAWRGPVSVVRSVDEALRAVGAIC